MEYGNGVDSTGVIPGDSTIVQYSTNGAIEHTYQISGEVDGLKVNPVTGMVWALQNQDANATISLINPATGTVIPGPFKHFAANSGAGQQRHLARRPDQLEQQGEPPVF